jgi:hypothetical protein
MRNSVNPVFLGDAVRTNSPFAETHGLEEFIPRRVTLEQGTAVWLLEALGPEPASGTRCSHMKAAGRVLEVRGNLVGCCGHSQWGARR